jgi:hypothetical protein
MTAYTALQRPTHLMKISEKAGERFYYTMTTPASGIAQNDDLTIVAIPIGYTVSDAWMSVSGTFGTSVTAQLRIGTTAITAATTAGGADTELQTTRPAPATAATTLNILFAGAAPDTAATVIVTGTLWRCSSVTLPGA